jgi:putative nucleotidyltransferase with HDIG domain
MLGPLATAIESRDPHADGHAARVAALADAVARELGWNRWQLRALRVGATLHDIGKLTVPARILRKEGPLEPEELEQLRTHPEVGVRLIQPIVRARCAIPYVLHHHERWDGRGYPHGLAGAAIPLEARLLALADAFDAMTSRRSYRPALADDEALAEIDRCAGKQFDPALARLFLAVRAGVRPEPLTPALL